MGVFHNVAINFCAHLFDIITFLLLAILQHHMTNYNSARILARWTACSSCVISPSASPLNRVVTLRSPPLPNEETPLLITDNLPDSPLPALHFTAPSLPT